MIIELEKWWPWTCSHHKPDWPSWKSTNCTYKVILAVEYPWEWIVSYLKPHFSLWKRFYYIYKMIIELEKWRPWTCSHRNLFGHHENPPTQSIFSLSMSLPVYANTFYLATTKLYLSTRASFIVSFLSPSAICVHCVLCIYESHSLFSLCLFVLAYYLSIQIPSI
jgi:hypothetical protein